MNFPQIPSMNTILGLGIDLIDIDRIARIKEKHGQAFLKRIFTSKELEYCLELSEPESSLAARFAGKEATSKALGTGIGEIQWTDIEILKDERGVPFVHLTEKLKKILEMIGGQKILISLSHTRTLAQAVVLVLTKPLK